MPKKSQEVFRCLTKDAPTNTLAKCYSVTIFQLCSNFKEKLEEIAEGECAYQRKKSNLLYKTFSDDFERQYNIMNRLCFSHYTSSGHMFLTKIKQEKYKSLEEKCIDLKKLLNTYIFEPLNYSCTEIVFDFALNKESQFVLLQIKDYKCQTIKRSTMQKTISIDNKEKPVDTECEGIVCKFAKDRQVYELVNILVDIGLLPRRWIKIGKYLVKQKIAIQFMDDSITY